MAEPGFERSDTTNRITTYRLIKLLNERAVEKSCGWWARKNINSHFAPDSKNNANFAVADCLADHASKERFITEPIPGLG